MDRPSRPEPSVQQLESVSMPPSIDSMQDAGELQDRSKVCTTTRVFVDPIPPFALSPEESESESSESSESKSIPRHDGSLTQHSPFGWFGDHLGRFQDLSTTGCQICSTPNPRTWWSIVLLDSCARDGCESCVIRLLAVFKIIQRDRIGRDMIYSRLQFQDSIITLRFSPGRRELDRRNKRAPFFPWTSRTIKIELYTSPDTFPVGWNSIIGLGRDIMHDRTTQCSKLIMAWLHSCSTYHTRCGAYINSLPGRVIDVGTSEAPKLRLRSSLGVRASYVVLSYSFDGWWRVPQTTKDNLLQRALEIPFHEMPPIFQDAVHIVRGLGLRYLWVDSLCVIQDDETNVSANVSSMASIYGNALFVIGAYRYSCSEKKRQPAGLLTTAYDRLRGDAFAHVENRDGSISQVQARLLGKPHGHFCGVSRSVGYGVPARAWAIQEQLLSSRMIHFTARELIWECRCLVGCECMELDRSANLKTALHKKAWFNKLLDKPVRDDFYKFWWFMLSKYCSRTFACGSDVLLAISALARQMQRHGAGSYHAGIKYADSEILTSRWRENLPHGLLWERRTPIFQAPKGCIAPSWSWASRVTYPSDIYEHKLKFGELDPTSQISSPIHREDLAEVWTSVIAVDTPPISTDSFGPVSSGQITLRGLLIEAKFREHPLTVPQNSKCCKMSLIQPLFLDGTPIWTTPDFDPIPSSIGDDLLLILIAKERGKSRKINYTRYRGLMLAKLKTDDIYQRIGTWEVPVLNEYNDIGANDFFPRSRLGDVRVV